MRDDKKRPVYEPPMARDLSAYSVSGVMPLGVCAAGPSPFDNCVTGLTFLGGCGGGSSPSACGAGSLPEQPSCRDGSNALVGCLAGGDA